MKGYNNLFFQLYFKVDFLENKASNEKFLFYIFDFFFRIKSLPFRSYHQLPTTLYIIDLSRKVFPIFAALKKSQVKRIEWPVDTCTKFV